MGKKKKLEFTLWLLRLLHRQRITHLLSAGSEKFQMPHGKNKTLKQLYKIWERNEIV